MNVRCKFRCNEVTKTEAYDPTTQSMRFQYSYRFTAVYSGSEENKKYFASTPNGELKITAFKDDLFEPGKEYFLDLTPAE